MCALHCLKVGGLYSGLSLEALYVTINCPEHAFLDLKVSNHTEHGLVSGGARSRLEAATATATATAAAAALQRHYHSDHRQNQQQDQH
jgi:hypothetical protein